MTVTAPDAAAPRFTIIIPTRERAATLEHALRTVTDQDFASLEIIVSDNASTDNTRVGGRSQWRSAHPLSQHRQAAQHVAQLGIRAGPCPRRMDQLYR